MLGTAGDAQGIDLSSEARFRLGAASIDPASREAAFNGTVERLQPQNLKVLVALAQKRGRVVSRDELIRRCWDGRVIGDDVINRAISTLRQFAERAGGFGIETVTRSGYRLVEKSADRKKRMWLAAGIVLLCAVALAVVAAIVFRQRAGAKPPVLTVALMPFETNSRDPLTQSLAFAAHDSVSHALTQTRFELSQPSAASGAKPSADFIISADVSSTPREIVATVRMEDTARNIVVFSHRLSVSPDKAWTLPEMIGPQVAGSLGWVEPILLLDREHPSNLPVIADLLQQTDVGQVAWLSDYERIRRDAAAAPDSAAAQLAFAYSSAFNLANLEPDQRPEAAALGRAAAARGERLAPKFGDSATAWCLLHSRVQLAECEQRLRAALQFDPNSMWVDYTLADRIKDAGRLSEALVLTRRSLATDEFEPGKIGLHLRMLEATGRSQDAQALYRQAHRWWPGNSTIFWDWLYGIIGRGDFDELVRFRNEVQDDPMFTEVGSQLSDIPRLRDAVKSGDVAAARKLCPGSLPPSTKLDLCMMAFARLGDADDAFALTSKNFWDRVGHSPADQERIWLAGPFITDTDIITGTGAEPLRRDPRYLELARRLGLLAYWRSGHLPDFCRPPQAEPICAKLKSRS